METKGRPPSRPLKLRNAACGLGRRRHHRLLSSLGLKCNVNKTECAMFIHKRNYCRIIRIRDKLIEYKISVKYLDVHLDKTMTMGK
ncbi:hypothetical protein EVAR_6045_1 [Eumeta japonica]|uniref:Uncharacterized protein n=1 Tax=Eumeta variegata TaxID=151549 RepID=A0A4C1T9P0_EUMVA|nr:hypothetical protein EVAR_6045_1 [Eumeta japonica]